MPFIEKFNYIFLDSDVIINFVYYSGILPILFSIFILLFFLFWLYIVTKISNRKIIFSKEYILPTKLYGIHNRFLAFIVFLSIRFCIVVPIIMLILYLFYLFIIFNINFNELVQLFLDISNIFIYSFFNFETVPHVDDFTNIYMDIRDLLNPEPSSGPSRPSGSSSEPVQPSGSSSQPVQPGPPSREPGRPRLRTLAPGPAPAEYIPTIAEPANVAYSEVNPHLPLPDMEELRKGSEKLDQMEKIRKPRNHDMKQRSIYDPLWGNISGEQELKITKGKTNILLTESEHKAVKEALQKANFFQIHTDERSGLERIYTPKLKTYLGGVVEPVSTLCSTVRDILKDFEKSLKK